MASPDRGLLDRVFSPQQVFLTQADSKAELLQALFDELGECEEVEDIESLQKAILEREALMSTGIGQGVGVPHARISGIRNLMLAVAINQTPLTDYTSIDGQPIQIVFLLAGRTDQQSDYVCLLSELSHLVKDAGRREALKVAETVEEVVSIFQAGLQKQDL